MAGDTDKDVTQGSGEPLNVVVKKPLADEPPNTLRKRKKSDKRPRKTDNNTKKEQSPRSTKRNEQPTKKKERKRIPSSYLVGGWLFERGVGIMYIIFFVGAWQQIHGLLGSTGISPIEEYISRIYKSPETSYYYWFFPSVFWISATDDVMEYLCIAGIVASIAITVDSMKFLSSIICWVAALSISTMGQEFFSTPSDLLLLEMGFFLIFLNYPSWNMGIRYPLCKVPSAAILWTYRFLIFRILFVFGMLQYFGSDASWRKGTFFYRYFETQSTPTIISWYGHHLPDWAHEALLLWILITEILMPLLIFVNPFLRKVAGLYITLMELFFLFSGNSGTWHFGILLLSLLLFDDSFWSRIPILSWIFFAKPVAEPKKNPRKTKSIKKISSYVLWFRKFWKCLVVFIALASIVLNFAPLSVASMGTVSVPQPLLVGYKFAHPWRVVNLYTPPQIPSSRKELVVQVSSDAHHWTDVGSLQSPDYRLEKPPPLPSLFFSRLEYKLYESASSTYEKEIWLSRFLHGLLSGSEPILSLVNPEAMESKPDYVRAMRYVYKFEGPSSKTNWWKRNILDIFTPTFSQTIQNMSSARQQFRSRKNKINF